MSNRIDELRQQKGLTWEQLAFDLNMSKAVIWRFGKGIREIKQSDLEILCKYFNVSPGYLLGYTDIKNNKTVEKLHDPLYIKIYNEMKDLDPDTQQDIFDMVSKMKDILQKK
jgi:transcriptional regulator with XRE-family HTH domain